MHDMHSSAQCAGTELKPGSCSSPSGSGKKRTGKGSWVSQVCLCLTKLESLESATGLAPHMGGIGSFCFYASLSLTSFFHNTEMWCSLKKLWYFWKAGNMCPHLGLHMALYPQAHYPFCVIFSSFVGQNQYPKQKLESERRSKSSERGLFMSPRLWSCSTVSLTRLFYLNGWGNFACTLNSSWWLTILQVVMKAASAGWLLCCGRNCSLPWALLCNQLLSFYLGELHHFPPRGKSNAHRVWAWVCHGMICSAKLIIPSLISILHLPCCTLHSLILLQFGLHFWILQKFLT